MFGFTHPIKGQGIYAFVTLKQGFEPSDELKKTLVQHVRKEIGPIASPDKLHFAEALPKTRSGKIMRRILRTIADAEYDGLGTCRASHDRKERDQGHAASGHCTVTDAVPERQPPAVAVIVTVPVASPDTSQFWDALVITEAIAGSLLVQRIPEPGTIAPPRSSRTVTASTWGGGPTETVTVPGDTVTLFTYLVVRRIVRS